MARLRPGWLLVLCAVGLSISSWLPWLTTSALGGGRASAIGGTVGSITLPPRFGAGQLIVVLASVLVVLGAMVARDLAPRPSAAVAAVISVSVVVLMWWYYDANVRPPVGAGYGLYLGAAFSVGLLACSVWALVARR
ncbi:MAG: hypothetical protein ACR2JI_07845 [Mycobacterium sp.]